MGHRGHQCPPALPRSALGFCGLLVGCPVWNQQQARQAFPRCSAGSSLTLRGRFVWQGLQWLQPLVSLPLPCVRDNPRVNPRDPLHHPWGLDPMSSHLFLFTPSLAGAQIPAPSGVVLGLCSAAHLVGSVAEQRILGVQAPSPGDVEAPSVSLGSTWRAGPHPGLIFSRVTCASSLFSLRL